MMIRHRQGIFIIEMLFCLGMLGIFSLVAGQVLVSSFKMMNQASGRAESAIQFDGAIKQLRADVAHSSDAKIDGGKLSLQGPAGATIHWQADEAGLISRQLADVKRQWNVRQPLQFSADGRIVLIRSAKALDATSALALPLGETR